MAKAETIGKRIEKVRMGQEMTQAEFSKAIGASQGRLSEWESGVTIPSAEGYVKLAAQAAKSDPDEALFFWTQAGLQPDAVISVADVLLKIGDVKMDAILATAEQVLKQQLGDQQQRAKEGKDFIVPPYPGVERLPFEVPVSALRVSNQATTYYLPVVGKDMFSRVGHNVEHGDILVFDSHEISSYDEIAGEKVVIEFKDGLYVGRLGYVAEGVTSHLVIGPSDVPPANWAFHVTPDLRLIRSYHAPDSRFESQSRRIPDEVQRYWGLWLDQFNIGAQESWKKMARQHKPRK